MLLVGKVLDGFGLDMCFRAENVNILERDFLERELR
jgi:hypothetical protein